MKKLKTYVRIISILISLLCTNSKPCIPSSGHTALVIGQDYYSITNYTSSYDFKQDPFGLMAYTALLSPTGSLKGLSDPINYGSGIEWVSGLLQKYPKSAMQLGLYLVDSWDDVINGSLDAEIDELAFYLKGLDVPVYLRIGYEFDSELNRYATQSYRDMFIRIVQRFRVIGSDNVAFVWHAAGFEVRSNILIEEWYPGDDFVDWCGINLFKQPYECLEQFKCEFKHADAVIKFCKLHKKPVMIAESTPYGGIIDTSSDEHSINEAGDQGDSWHRWYGNVMNYIEKHDIRLWSYINCDWDAQPMWQKNHADGEKWGDTRVEAYPGIRQKWLLEVVEGRRYRWANDPDEKKHVCDPVESASDRLSALHEQLLLYAFAAILLASLYLLYVGVKGHWMSRSDKYLELVP